MGFHSLKSCLGSRCWCTHLAVVQSRKQSARGYVASHTILRAVKEKMCGFLWAHLFYFCVFVFFFPWTNQCLSEEPCSSVTFLWLTKSLLRFTSEGCINMGWWSNSVHLSDSAFLTAFEKLVIWNVADGWNCFSGSWGLSIPKLHQPGFGNWFTISSGPSGRH